MTEDEGDPIGYELLRRGVPVVTADGRRLGEVVKALDNAREHIFDGIVVRTTDGRRVFVDAPEVARIAERRVTLTISLEETRELPGHHGGLLGAVEQGTRRRMSRLKRRLPGR